jgi:hypothetical protein
MWPVDAATTVTSSRDDEQGGSMPARRRSAQLGTLLATLLLSAGCGSTEPEPLQAVKPEIPADLCATVPTGLRGNLITNSNSDGTGNPTAACSLRSPDGSSTVVQAVVTWLQTNDDETGADVLESQCNAVDHADFREQTGFEAKGADQACGASGQVDGADSATVAASAGNQVVTVRLTSLPPGRNRSLDRAQQMLEGVLSSLAGP